MIFLFKVWVFKRPQTIFTVVCLQVYCREGQNKYFLRLNFYHRKQWSPNYINQSMFLSGFHRYSYTALFELMKTVKLLLFVAICADFSESSQVRNWNFSMKPIYFLPLSYHGIHCVWLITLVIVYLHWACC